VAIITRVTPPVEQARIRFSQYVSQHGGDRAVADMLGCSRSLVCLIRTGQRTPGLSVAAAISRVTKIPAQLWNQERKPRVPSVRRSRKRKS